MSVFYNPGKDNVVVEALCQMSMGSEAHVPDDKNVFMKELQRLDRFVSGMEDSTKGGLYGSS